MLKSLNNQDKQKLYIVAIVVLVILLSIICAYTFYRLYDYIVGEDYTIGMIDDNIIQDNADKELVMKQLSEAAVITSAVNNDDLSVSSGNLEVTQRDATDALLGAQEHIDTIPPDLKGWLTVDGLDVNDPVMQWSDNDYYLTHNELGKKSKWGCYYFSANNNTSSIKDLDRKTVIFGHSNGNSTHYRFSVLKKFKDKDFASKYRFLHLTIDGVNSDWEIFSVCDYPIKDTNLLDMNPSDADFKEEVLEMKKLSYNTYNVPIQYKDKILILCTCTGHNEYSTRFLVCAKLVN